MDEKELNHMIRCIGIDGKQHLCLPESNICKCGAMVNRKKLLKNDYELFWL